MLSQHIKEKRDEFISKFTVWNSRYKYATLKGVEEYPTPDDIADWWKEKNISLLEKVIEMIEKEKRGEDFEELCPVCGYYCLSNGKVGCIDKKNSYIRQELYNSALTEIQQLIRDELKNVV